jgi:hypothetical protein
VGAAVEDAVAQQVVVEFVAEDGGTYTRASVRARIFFDTTG